jgi:hypothetical protein
MAKKIGTKMGSTSVTNVKVYQTNRGVSVHRTEV